MLLSNCVTEVIPHFCFCALFAIQIKFFYFITTLGDELKVNYKHLDVDRRTFIPFISFPSVLTGYPKIYANFWQFIGNSLATYQYL